jgi:hypothetical protein
MLAHQAAGPRWHVNNVGTSKLERAIGIEPTTFSLGS